MVTGYPLLADRLITTTVRSSNGDAEDEPPVRLAQLAGAPLAAQAAAFQDLDGDGALEQRVIGTVDDAHAPFAQLGLDAVTLVEQGTQHGFLRVSEERELGLSCTLERAPRRITAGRPCQTLAPTRFSRGERWGY